MSITPTPMGMSAGMPAGRCLCRTNRIFRGSGLMQREPERALGVLRRFIEEQGVISKRL